MEVTRTVDIDAPPSEVWAVMADLERWPEWTESIKKVEVLDSGPFGSGLKARLEILGAPGVGTWTVTSCTEGREFSWEYGAPGIHTVATHVIEPSESGSRVTLGVRQEGPGTWLLSPWLKRVNARNLGMEAAGLKRAAEARAHSLASIA